MLVNALFSVALLALITTTILSAGLAMTRMAMTHISQTYVAAGYQRALTTLQTTIGAQLQAGKTPNPQTTFSPLPAACADAACAYTTAETIVLTQTAAATPGPSCDATATNCAANLQTNAYVDESRLTARITVTVRNAADKSVFVSRRGDIILRTLSVPPYVVIAGSREGTFDDVVAKHAAGDDGGLAPATPNPCGTNATGIASDTAVRVAYRNQQTAACTDGSSWAASSYSSKSATPSGWSP